MRTLVVALLSLFAHVAIAGTVQLTAADGQRLVAESSGTGPRGVVLVHADGRSAADWKDLTPKLVAAGLRVIAVDLRGHGASGGPLAEETYPAMVQDVASAVAWLRGQGVKDVSVVGAELGGSLALLVAAADPVITTVVAVSPRLSLHGVRASAALETFGARPLLLLAGAEDTTGVRAAGAIAGKLGASVRLEVSEAGGGVGIGLLQRDARLAGLVVSWVDAAGVLGDDGPRSGALRTTTEASGLETTGTRIGETP